MAQTITIDLILDEFGRYYEQAGQNRRRLVRDLMQPPVTLETYASRIKTRDTIYKMANYIFESVIKPFKKEFDPSGNVKFFPNPIPLKQIKVDVELYPHDIEDSWLGFLSGDDARTLQSWPIVRWIMEEYILKQVQEDRELHAVYKGVYDPNGITPSDCMDGIKKLLIDGANAQYPINVIDDIGALSPSTIFAQVEAYDKAIPELYQNQPLIHFMSLSNVRAFKEDKRSNGYYFITDASKITTEIDFTNHAVVGLPSMSGTNDIFTTIKPNLLHITKRGDNMFNLDVQKHDRCIHILTDWWEGIGFACNKLVWTTRETVNVDFPITEVSAG